MPYVNFASTNSQFLTFGNSIAKPDNYTILLVATQPSANTCILGSGDTNGLDTNSWGKICTNGSNYYTSGFGDDTNSTLGTFSSFTVPNILYGPSSNANFGIGWASNQLNLLSVRHTSGQNSLDFYVNGKLASDFINIASYSSSVATHSSGATNVFSIGRPGDYNGKYASTKVFEVILYSKALSNAERAWLEGYLNAKYRIW